MEIRTIALWHGLPTEVTSDRPCPTQHAGLSEMLHYGEPGTGYLQCADCGGVALNPELETGRS